MKLIMVIALFVLAVVVLGILTRRRFRPRQEVADAETTAAQKNNLLVILRSAPADLRPETIDAAAWSAWSGPFGTNDDGSGYVDRSIPNVMAILQARGNAFLIFGAERSSRAFEPPTAFLPESAAGLWEDYSHDLSVGVTYNFETDAAGLAAFVSTLTAALCDAHAIAIYHPASRRLWKLDAAVRARLAAGSAEFFDAAGAGVGRRIL